MRVCFISHSAGRYGAELALLELLQGLVKLGVRCEWHLLKFFRVTVHTDFITCLPPRFH